MDYFAKKTAAEMYNEQNPITEKEIAQSKTSVKFDEKNGNRNTLVKCPKCNNEIEFTYRGIKEHEKIIECNKCHNILSLTTVNQKNYLCEYCDKKFSTYEAAEKHEQNCKENKELSQRIIKG